MKASEQYFPAVLLIMLYKVALESVYDIFKFDHSIKTILSRTFPCDFSRLWVFVDLCKGS